MPPKLNSDLASATPQDNPDSLAALCWQALARIEDLEELLRKVHDTGEVTGRTVCEVPRDVMTDVYEAIS